MLSFISGLGETGPEQERSNETVILGQPREVRPKSRKINPENFSSKIPWYKFWPIKVSTMKTQ